MYDTQSCLQCTCTCTTNVHLIRTKGYDKYLGVILSYQIIINVLSQYGEYSLNKKQYIEFAASTVCITG